MVLWRNLICLESVKGDYFLNAPRELLMLAHTQRVEMPIGRVKTHKGDEVG